MWRELGLLLVFGAIGGVFLAWRASAGHVVPVAPDPDVVLARVAAPVEPAEPAEPGVAAPLLTTERKPTRHHPRPPLKLDTIEPWNGEDLAPALAIDIQQRPRLEISRVDPWDDTVIYPAQPPMMDGNLDEDDPWGVVASRETRARPAARQRMPGLLDASDPWAATGGGAPTNGARLAVADRIDSSH
jgi:hypothetical protein